MNLRKKTCETVLPTIHTDVSSVVAVVVNQTPWQKTITAAEVEKCVPGYA